MSEQVVRVSSTGVDIAYERLGDPDSPPVVLIMGLANQMINWPDGFCQALVARALHLVRFDNRDVGHSSRIVGGPMPNLQAALQGDYSSAPYTLSDMAADTVGLLDALGLDSAHFVGVSMGGAIAQLIAIEHPSRARSITSIMSTTGSRAVGQPDRDVLRKLFGSPPATTREEMMERAVRSSQIIGSATYAKNEAAIRETAGRAFDRGHDPMSVARQSLATMAAGDRTERLKSLAIPALVVHGSADLLCDASGGRATAAAIPNAELWEVEGMGHDLPTAVWPELTSRIASLVERAEARWRTRLAAPT